MAMKTSIYKHHNLPLHVTPSHCIPLTACNMSPHRKVFHTNAPKYHKCVFSLPLHILTIVLELRWSSVGIKDWWCNEQFWVIGGVSAYLFAVFQGFLKMLAGISTNFTVTAKAAEDAEFGELYVFKWTILLIPPSNYSSCCQFGGGCCWIL